MMKLYPRWMRPCNHDSGTTPEAAHGWSEKDDGAGSIIIVELKNGEMYRRYLDDSEDLVLVNSTLFKCSCSCSKTVLMHALVLVRVDNLKTPTVLNCKTEKSAYFMKLTW